MIAYIETFFSHPTLHETLGSIPAFESRLTTLVPAITSAPGFSFREVVPSGARIYFDSVQALKDFMINQHAIFSAHLTAVESELGVPGLITVSHMTQAGTVSEQLPCNYTPQQVGSLTL